MPYTTNVAGTTITASWANANVRDQVVNPFASTAARDAAITVPVAGMVAVTTDTNTVWTYSGTAWVQTAQNGAWTAYTPTLTQSGTVTATVGHAVWARWGRLIVVNVNLTVTGTGTGANAVTVTLPVTAARSGTTNGTGHIFDSSANTVYTANVITPTTSTVQFYAQGVNVSTAPLLGSFSFTAALAANDVVTFQAIYEAAS